MRKTILILLLSTNQLLPMMPTQVSPTQVSPTQMSNDERYIRNMIESEVNVLESDYRHLGKDEYRNSPWFALRVLFPIKRKASWEILDKNHFFVTRYGNYDIGETEQENMVLKFISALKIIRPHLTGKQLTTIFVLMNALPDIFTQDILNLISDNIFKLNLWKSKNIQSLICTTISRPFMDFYEISAELLNTVLIRSAQQIESGEVEFSGYSSAYDKISKLFDKMSIPGIKQIMDAEYAIDRYLSESNGDEDSRAAKATLKTLQVTGNILSGAAQVVGSFFQSFGAVLGSEAGNESAQAIRNHYHQED